MPTPATRAIVAQLKAGGRTLNEIATAIQISAPTLLLNYPGEMQSSSQTGVRRAAKDVQSAARSTDPNSQNTNERN